MYVIKNFYCLFNFIGLKFCQENCDLDIIGLMCLPPNILDNSKHFEEMNKAAKSLSLKELSMGMSSDYLNAVKHNATYVRIGSKIFGERG